MKGNPRVHAAVRWMIGALIALVWFGVAGRAAQAEGFHYYFPIMGGHLGKCYPTTEEQAFADLMAAHPEQQRPLMRCNVILNQVARQHAADMANRGYVGYITPEGKGMNELVREAGYRLPYGYSTAPGANEVASIAVGHESAWYAWQSMINPAFGPQPRTHLLGLHPFYARQIDYGIGHVYNPSSAYGHYWVIITAEPLFWPLAASPSVQGDSLHPTAPDLEHLVIYAR